MNNIYLGFYKNKKYQIEAKTAYEAQVKLGKQLKIRRDYLISIHLVEVDGKEIIHTADF